MARFIFPGKYAMRPMKGKGKKKSKVLAYFNVVDTKIGIEFRDVRLIEGENGVFVGAPFRTYEKNNETKYSDYWRAAYDEDTEARNETGVAYLEEMAEAAYEKYRESAEGEDDDEDEDERPARRSSQRSGRGPVRPKAKDEEEEAEEEDERPRARSKGKDKDEEGEEEEEEKPRPRRRLPF